MAYGFLDIALTPSVRKVQEQMNADGIWSEFKGHRAFDRQRVGGGERGTLGAGS